MLHQFLPIPIIHIRIYFRILQIFTAPPRCLKRLKRRISRKLYAPLFPFMFLMLHYLSDTDIQHGILPLLTVQYIILRILSSIYPHLLLQCVNMLM